MSENRPKGLGVLLALFGLLLVVVVGSVVWVAVNANDGDPRPWTTYELDGDNVIITYTAEGCVDGSGVSVDETARDVTLTLKVSEGGSCDSTNVDHTVTAVLKQPLAHRALLDGACLSDTFRNDAACAKGAQRN